MSTFEDMKPSSGETIKLFGEELKKAETALRVALNILRIQEDNLEYFDAQHCNGLRRWARDVEDLATSVVRQL